ncbi:SRPBCC family protein [Actinomadura sp. ATCC 31491]|uniref:SRPBCC family protein n=1 Tax=Actinomadura luzonensis TaxID=2805427 RepID=A0ABT0G4E9_9ACTN|nr:SRPBCC family protein [Actinomadura luzonensis]MCK2219374.1 SRPBCC family protein [Actinomadura luzonensis]
MPETLLRNTFHVPAPPAAVLAHLSEPASYVGLSPLVVEVREVRREPDGVRYTCVERFRFLGLLRYDNHIEVTLRPTRDGVAGEVDSPGGVRLAYRFALSGRDGGTEVRDELRVRAAFGPLLRYAARKAREVQLARAGVLAARAPALRA